MIKKVFVFILSVAALACMLSGCVCIPTRVPIEYRSRMTVYVSNDVKKDANFVNSITASDLAVSQKLVDTYSYIIQSNKVRNEVLALSGVSSDFTVEINPLNETQVIEIWVIASQPQIAYDVSCAYAQVIPHAIEEIVEGSSVKLIDAPRMPTVPSAYKWAWG